jgi:tetratricopeptide (TPR) repeat protein
MRTSRRTVFGCTLGAMALCAALPGLLWCQEDVRLEGRVRTETGAILKSGVTVRLESDEGQVVREQPVNSEGAFEFDGLRKVTYRLIVTAEGFEPYQEMLELGYGGAVVIRNIVLRRAARIAPGKSTRAARSDDLAPKSARREYEQAASELAAKNLEEARKHLKNAVQQYPCYARAQTDLAAILEASRDQAGAEAALKKARECDPDYLDSYIMLGQLLNGQKRYTESAQVLAEGVRRSPSSWQFFYQLGIAHYGLGQYARAEADYQKVLQLNASPPAELHVKLADVYLKEGAYDQAYSQMETYLRTEPHGRFADKVKGIMKQMKASGVVPAVASSH